MTVNGTSAGFLPPPTAQGHIFCVFASGYSKVFLSWIL